MPDPVAPKPADAATATAVTPAAAVTPAVITPPAKAADPAPAAAPVADAKPADGKPAAADAVKPGEKPAEPVFDLKAPEGVQVEKATLDEVVAFAKAEGLTPAQAQKILDRDLGTRQAVAESAQAALRHTADKVWPEQVKADKEIGGAAFAENLSLAKKALDTFGSADLKKALNETGLGNHPELVRFCVKVGKTLGDDSIIPAGKPTGAKARVADRLFAQPAQKQE